MTVSAPVSQVGFNPVRPQRVSGSFAVFLPEEAAREEDLSTQHTPSCPSPRLPSPHVHPGWPANPASSTASGSCPAIGLIGPIRERSTFAALSRLGSRASKGPLTAVFVPDTGVFQHPQVAFAVPRSVGNAVVRNRIRRRIRAILIGLAADQRLPAGAWLFIVRPTLSALDHQELTAVVESVITGAAQRQVV